jgi:hypothetical protein
MLHIVVNKGALTCIMSIECWKSLVSPKLDMYNTMLKSFNGHMFHPNGIIVALPIKVGGDTFSIVVEVVNAPLEYNMLLQFTWFYDMKTIISLVLRVLCFPHQGTNVTINQLVFCTPTLISNVGSNVPFIDDSKSA